MNTYRIILQLPGTDVEFQSSTIHAPDAKAREVWDVIDQIDRTQVTHGLHVNRIEQLVGAGWTTV